MKPFQYLTKEYTLNKPVGKVWILTTENQKVFHTYELIICMESRTETPYWHLGGGRLKGKVA